MKIALISLPRSRSECLFNTLAPIALQCGMEVYRPTGGDYYYINNDVIKPDMFCKIETRTPLDRFKRIVEQFEGHTWWVTTRDFEDFCLSLSYALSYNKFHDFDDTEYFSFELLREHYDYAVETYAKFKKMVDIIPEKTIIDYNDITGAGKTKHNDKDYKTLCTNYQQFRDWQRVDYIMSLEWERKWNCYTSFNERNLQDHPLFSDIVDSKVMMWYNVYKLGDSQDWHTHDGVKSCGTRFLKLPKKSGKLCFKGWNQQNVEHTQIEFTSKDKHRVTTNQSDDYRITISWNVV
tara:strand:- start:519 stop:1394 length:876 start_codon:yes stop_codon:yes gene_type:complete